jgi:hypothetical protein
MHFNPMSLDVILGYFRPRFAVGASVVQVAPMVPARKKVFNVV